MRAGADNQLLRRQELFEPFYAAEKRLIHRVSIVDRVQANKVVDSLAVAPHESFWRLWQE